jgi:hypothetical protein
MSNEEAFRKTIRTKRPENKTRLEIRPRVKAEMRQRRNRDKIETRPRQDRD